MDKKPLVSVIIPAFNEAKVIGRLLESLAGQTYGNIETIVIDDFSTDSTAAVAGRFKAKVFTRSHADRSKQRNFGAKKSKGEYLIFLDADMELTPKVVAEAVAKLQLGGWAALVIPEKTVGKGFIQKLRRFEREMYLGDATVEAARVFRRERFFEFGGYDESLTGPEDYDLPYRIGKKYKIGRVGKFILHHEERRTLAGLLKNKFHYAQKGAGYARKHPELIATQGNLLLRKAYFKNWRKFIKEPLLGVGFIGVRTLEMIAAVLGYLSVVGPIGFVRTLGKMLLSKPGNKR